MRDYELAFIIRPTVDDEGVTTTRQNRLAALLRGSARLVGLENLDRLPLDSSPAGMTQRFLSSGFQTPLHRRSDGSLRI